jgi:hypothetical protein
MNLIRKAPPSRLVGLIKQGVRNVLVFGDSLHGFIGFRRASQFPESPKERIEPP